MRVFGLDISDSFIRLAEVDRRGPRLTLPVRGEIPVPAGLIVDGEIMNQEDVSGLLRQLVRAAGLRTKQVVAAIPERHSFIKLISLAAEVDDHELDAAVKNEAVQHLPYALEEVYFDWHRLPTANSLGQRQVVIGAAPRPIVDSYVRTLAAADLQPISLEIEALAIARAIVRPADTAGASILLDLGRSRSTLILLQNGVVQFTATIRYAGRELNTYIAEELHITESQAERAKSLFGVDPHRGKGLLHRVLRPHLDTLADKIREIESFYAEHFVDHQPIRRVILTGSGAMMRGITDELAQRLEQPVARQPSWVYQDILLNDPAMNAELAYTYTTAFGLALEAIEQFV